MSKGERIKQLRENLNMSQTEMAEKIGVSKQSLYKYENNIITNIPSDKIEAIAKLAGSTPAFIMGWEETKDNDHTKDLLNLLDKMTDEEMKELIDYMKYLISKRK